MPDITPDNLRDNAWLTAEWTQLEAMREEMLENNRRIKNIYNSRYILFCEVIAARAFQVIDLCGEHGATTAQLKEVVSANLPDVLPAWSMEKVLAQLVKAGRLTKTSELRTSRDGHDRWQLVYRLGEGHT